MPTRPERLAERFFDLVAERDRDALADLLHPDVIFSSVTMDDDFSGREDVLERFYDQVFSWLTYEVTTTSVGVYSDTAALAEGRIQWMNNGSLRDSPVVWLLDFRDDQLYRLISTDSRERTLRAAGVAPPSLTLARTPLPPRHLVTYLRRSSSTG